MIIYLSGPMSNLPDLNFPAFNEAAAQLRSKGYEVISPAEVEQPDKVWSACMRNDIPELMKADTLALLLGWEKSDGARIEIINAVLLGYKIVDAYTLEPISLEVNVDIKEMNGRR